MAKIAQTGKPNTKEKFIKSTKERIEIKRAQQRNDELLADFIEEECSKISEEDDDDDDVKLVELPEGSYEYCTFNESDKTLRLDLKEIFGRDDLDYIDTFHITKKNYFKIGDKIAFDYNLVLNTRSCDEFIFYLLDVKSVILEIKDRYINESRGYIQRKKNMTELEKRSKMVLDDEDKQLVIDKINGILELDYLFDFISEFVDERYILNLDSRINVNEKNLEYAVTDRINQTVLKTSIIIRLLIPLLNEISIDGNNFYKLGCAIMKKFDGEVSNTKNKLFKFISLRVDRTKYSDSTIWDYLGRRGVDSNLFISELNKSMVNEILCKLDYNKSIVSYFDVITRFKIRYLFTYNYNVNYRPIKTSDKELDDKEKMEMYLTKHDSFELNIHKYSIKQIADSVIVDRTKYDVEEIANLNNPFTSRILSLFYHKEGFNISFATPEQRALLIIKMVEELKCINGFLFIPEILLSEVTNIDKRTTNKKKLDAEILNSREYAKFEESYADVMYMIVNNNHPVAQIASISKYEVIQRVNEHSYDQLDISYKDLIFELLYLCNAYVS